MAKHDIALIGGGLVGLATALALGRRRPDLRLLVLEKESDWASHQSGHNSGVIHSGVYYPPGSLKARYAIDGNRSMAAFCAAQGIPFDICGKLIVATDPADLARLTMLYERGLAHGLELTRLGPEEVRDIEPHVSCLAAIRVASAGIADYRLVARRIAELVAAQGGDLKLGTRVDAIRAVAGGFALETTGGAFEVGALVNCGGLFSDRLARKGGIEPEARIVPFRGEYYELVPSRQHLIKHLVYPVPNPDFPFLGVHFTRMIDGRIHAGPNAVLALKREGYRKSDVSLSDAAESLLYPGFWRLAGRHYREGFLEIVRSLSKAVFVRSLQRLVPEITADDLKPSPAGVRAQALAPDGRLVDDFRIHVGPRAIHVCNAPSPAATASLEIGEAIAMQLEI
jgi:L-2-hydroxyglutarate oxidase